jgi:hypothetical protein
MSTIPRAAAALLLLASVAACAGAQQPATRHAAAPRIVAIGDVHGDLDAARRALRLAGAIDERDRWTGGRLVVVQTGDQIDRGDEEVAVLHLFDRLAREAAQAGGAVHALNGNHELMNAQLDLRYVTAGGWRDFQRVVRVPSEPDAQLLSFPPEQRARVVAFRPGGPYARLLARRNTIVIVGDIVFAHGGVLPAHAEYGIERINEEIRAWLLGLAPPPPTSRGADSPIWTRLYSREPDAEACGTLRESLRILGVRRMVVGHTVHRRGITSYCDGQVWAIDVGMAKHYGGDIEVLEILGGTVRPLREEECEGCVSQ